MAFNFAKILMKTVFASQLERRIYDKYPWQTGEIFKKRTLQPLQFDGFGREVDFSWSTVDQF